MEKNMEKECELGLMEIYMKVSLWMIWKKDLGNTGGQLVKNIREIEREGSHMEKECRLRIMESYQKVCGSKEKELIKYFFVLLCIKWL